ncbi:MAG: hypothetical protein ABI724_09985 [Betaproteobacteria bacterium]
MNGVEPNKAVENDADSVASVPAETKRKAARRRFLARGTAAGSGLLIVTLYHQRGMANPHGQKVLVSSIETCASIGGKKAGEKDVKDSVTGKKVKRIECELP